VLSLVACGAWWLGARTQSPEQAAAKASPPEASWITEAVQRRLLTSTVVLRGDVVSAASLSIGIPSSVDGPQVVTRVPAPVGSVLAEGAVVIEVSGRPVFIMQGDVPSFRFMQIGVRGVDVAQLQAALSRLGYPLKLDGAFGKGTAQAVIDFYTNAGYASSDGSVPFGEVMFVPTLPARVQSSVTMLGPIGSDEQSASVDGSEADGSGLVRLSAGELTVSTFIPAADEGFLRVGVGLVLLDESTNSSYSATLTSIGDTTTDQSGRLGRAATVTPKDVLPPELAGSNLRLTFTTSASDGEVLVVPLAAVSASADGKTRVSVLRPGVNTPVDVLVEVGISADGFVEIQPTVDGSLQEGDLVVVGR